MKNKIIILTLFLAIGFSFYNCDPPCNCGPVESFFDVQAVELQTVNCQKGFINEGDVTPFADVCTKIKYLVEYHSYQEPMRWNFSLMNSALACSCAWDGWQGSKTEKLKELTVITLNDFDADHLKNDTINDLLFASHIYRLENIDLQEYLLRDTTTLQEEYLDLYLKKAPELDSMYHFKVIIELSNGERYEEESEPMIVE